LSPEWRATSRVSWPNLAQGVNNLQTAAAYPRLVNARSALAAVAVAAVVLARGASAQLPSPPVASVSPAFSPDGTKVAYALRHAGGERGWLVFGSAAGGGLRSVYSSMDSCCGPIAWASSEQIVFIDDYQLKRVDLRSGSVAALDTGAPSFMLSPNRQTIAIDQGCECGHAPDAVGLVGLDGRVRLIPRPKTATDELDGFSPDGTELVFSRYRFVYDNTPMNKPSLFAVSVKGGAPVPLSKSGLIGAADLPVGADNVSWSPDGRWLSYFTSKGLWLMSTSTGKPRLAVSSHGWGRPLSRAIAWSPTSTELAYPGIYTFGKQTKSGQQPWITRLVVVTTGGTRTQLWHAPLIYVSGNSQEPPQWAPDGKSLVFSARPNAASGLPNVYVVGADGHGLHQIG
jgi:Tol biopolymer transport system component